VPLESQTGIVLSGASRRPCPDPPAGALGGDRSESWPGGSAGASGGERNHPKGIPPLPVQTARFVLPTIELSQRLADLMQANSGLAEGFPDLIWRSVPDPLPTCEVLDRFIAQLEVIEERASAAKATCLFLWEISAAEQARKREREGGVR